MAFYVTPYRAYDMRGNPVAAKRFATDTPRDTHYCYEHIDLPGMSVYSDARPEYRDYYTRGAEVYPDRAACEAAHPDIPGWAWECLTKPETYKDDDGADWPAPTDFDGLDPMDGE